MAHLICVAHTRLELADILVSFRQAGIDNLLALGGDEPSDPDDGPGELRHAIELVELAQAIGGFSIGVAAHPALHPRSESRRTDRDYLAAKLRLADFAVTQFFFDVADYEGLIEDLGRRGLDKPVLPGIMPVDTLRSIDRMATMGSPLRPGRSGASRTPTPRVGRRPCAARASPSPPSCARPCSSGGHRACTSTLSTGRARRGRSTTLSASSGRLGPLRAQGR